MSRIENCRTGLVCIVALLGFTNTAWAQCNDISSQYELCPGCAFQFCYCLYAGQHCVTEEIICGSRPAVVSGIFEIENYGETYCYTVAPCESLNGGSCNPLTNPCVIADSGTPVGSFPLYRRLDLCGIIG